MEHRIKKYQIESAVNQAPATWDMGRMLYTVHPEFFAFQLCTAPAAYVAAPKERQLCVGSGVDPVDC